MAVVRVGVKRIKKGTGYETDEVGEAGIELQQHWVELNGLRLDGYDYSLVRVEYDAGEDPTNTVAAVRVHMNCEGFSTVDYREPAPGHARTGDPTAEDLDPMARRMFQAALNEHRAGELLQCLFEGGSATVDASERLVLASGDMLNQMANP